MFPETLKSLGGKAVIFAITVCFTDISKNIHLEVQR